MQKRKIELAALIVAAGFGLSACGGGSSNVKPDPNDNNKIDPGSENPSKPLADLNEPAPKSGEFISNKGYKFSHADTSSSILNTGNTVKKEGLISYETRTSSKQRTVNGETFKETISTGVNLVVYDKDGKFKGVIIGEKPVREGVKSYPKEKVDKVNGFKVYSLDNKKLKAFSQTKAEDINLAQSKYILDAGLTKSGDKRFGLYANTKDRKFIIRDPAAAGWNYQTFGAFDSGSKFNYAVAYQSFGMNTTKPQMQKLNELNGTATYTGISSAHYYEGGNFDITKQKQTTSDVTIKADFGKRSLDFETKNTKLYTLGDGFKFGNPEAKSNLNLKGSAKWDAGSSKFVGNVKSTDKTLSGKLNGSFYGDKAAEVGGTFGLKSSNSKNVLIGGFGAKRK